MMMSSSVEAGKKKLGLVLDLDHTLLHSTKIASLSPEEEEGYLNKKDIEEDVFLWESCGFLTKLRPFAREFLEQASKLFNLYIFTMGTQPYALRMASYLDPNHSLFSSRLILSPADGTIKHQKRIFSKEDCKIKHQKGLDVLPVNEAQVIILDDTESVWESHKNNLILIRKYHFFSPTENKLDASRPRSLSELKMDESEASRALNSVLKVLKRIHSLYFDIHNVQEPDVRQVLNMVRKEASDGCRSYEGNDNVGRKQQPRSETTSCGVVLGKRLRCDDDESPSQGSGKRQKCKRAANLYSAWIWKQNCRAMKS